MLFRVLISISNLRYLLNLDKYFYEILHSDTQEYL